MIVDARLQIFVKFETRIDTYTIKKYLLDTLHTLFPYIIRNNAKRIVGRKSCQRQN